MTVMGVPLNRQQGRLVEALCVGATNKQIAAWMGLTEATVKQYLCALYAKLGLARRAGNARDLVVAGCLGEKIDGLQFVRVALTQRVRELEAELKAAVGRG